MGWCIQLEYLSSVNCRETGLRMYIWRPASRSRSPSCSITSLLQNPTNLCPYSPASSARDDRFATSPFTISTFPQFTNSPRIGYRAKAGVHRLGWICCRGTFSVTSPNIIGYGRYPDSALSSACFRCLFERKFVPFRIPANQRVLTGYSCTSAK